MPKEVIYYAKDLFAEVKKPEDAPEIQGAIDEIIKKITLMIEEDLGRMYLTREQVDFLKVTIREAALQQNQNVAIVAIAAYITARVANTRGGGCSSSQF